MYGQSYSETESGFLFRPAIALQPSIRIGESVVLYPFIGLSESYGIVTLEWDLDYTLAEGRRVPFTQEAMAAIRMDASDSRWSGEGTDSVDVGTTMFAGFDVGMLVGKSGGEISLGAAISELSGETDSSDFQEAHIVYSYPL